jgi:hypothetical protein
MQKKKLILFAVILLLINLPGLQAQEAITASGGNASGSNGSVSYSVGQVAYTTISGANGIVPLGVQQTYTISVRAHPEKNAMITLQFIAYPNPATDFLTLKVNRSYDFSLSKLYFRLLDMNGKLLQSGKIADYETSISMVGLAPSVYCLNVFSLNEEVISFNIIKK